MSTYSVLPPRSIKHEVERRIVSQLALAHEHALIKKGCALKLIIDRSSHSDHPDENGDWKTIKLQINQPGSLFSTHRNLDLDSIAPRIDS